METLYLIWLSCSQSSTKARNVKGCESGRTTHNRQTQLALRLGAAILFARRNHTHKQHKEGHTRYSLRACCRAASPPRSTHGLRPVCTQPKTFSTLMWNGVAREGAYLCTSQLSKQVLYFCIQGIEEESNHKYFGMVLWVQKEVVRPGKRNCSRVSLVSKQVCIACLQGIEVEKWSYILRDGTLGCPKRGEKSRDKEHICARVRNRL